MMFKYSLNNCSCRRIIEIDFSFLHFLHFYLSSFRWGTRAVHYSHDMKVRFGEFITIEISSKARASRLLRINWEFHHILSFRSEFPSRFVWKWNLWTGNFVTTTIDWFAAAFLSVEALRNSAEGFFSPPMRFICLLFLLAASECFIVHQEHKQSRIYTRNQLGRNGKWHIKQAKSH